MDATLILVTLFSLTLAAVMTTLAWRLARDEHRRSDARVAALAAEIAGDAPRATIESARADLPLQPVETSSELFATAQPTASRPRLAAVMAIGVLVFGAAALLAVVTSRTHATAGPRSTQGPAAPQAAPAPAQPLELVALTHERDADRLTVHGIVRNPSAGAGIDRLTAVVLLFNREGGFVTSGRGVLERATLGPGSEAPFTVTIPGVADVGRYRVSFRTDERVIPHVDRRERVEARLNP